MRSWWHWRDERRVWARAQRKPKHPLTQRPFGRLTALTHFSVEVVSPFWPASWPQLLSRDALGRCLRIAARQGRAIGRV